MFASCSKWTIFDILKFILGSEACGNKTKEMYYSLLSLKMVSFVFFSPQSSQPSMNFNISELVYNVDRRRSCSHGNILFDLQSINRLLTHPVFSVDVCTMFQQKFNNRLLSVPTGKMKRGQKKLPKIGKTNAVKYR